MDHAYIEVQRPREAPDADPLARPGVPQELDPPEPLADAHWLSPEPQLTEPKPLVGQGRPLTPVFSTAIPPRHLSGVVRRLAYRIPDYEPRRWMLLMLADRIDVLEHNPRRLLKLGATVGLIMAMVYAVRRSRRS